MFFIQIQIKEWFDPLESLSERESTFSYVYSKGKYSLPNFWYLQSLNFQIGTQNFHKFSSQANILKALILTQTRLKMWQLFQQKKFSIQSFWFELATLTIILYWTKMGKCFVWAWTLPTPWSKVDLIAISKIGRCCSPLNTFFKTEPHTNFIPFKKIVISFLQNTTGLTNEIFIWTLDLLSSIELKPQIGPDARQKLSLTKYAQALTSVRLKKAKLKKSKVWSQ